MSKFHTGTEEFRVNGEELVGKIKQLLHESNIRRIILKDKEGRTLIATALTSAADIDVTATELRVTLAPLSSLHRTQTVAALCAELDREAIFTRPDITENRLSMLSVNAEESVSDTITLRDFRPVNFRNTLLRFGFYR